ncbi:MULTISPECIES: hypothetical protein [unclassified Streptomyces]|uniref:hypothetical protein n=1 Tax=unclassified Streptomyces TaxID=2593676 RepID=UPI0037FAEDAE
MVDRTATPEPRREPETLDEAAARTGRPVTTLRHTYSRHPAWPAPLPERRGRHTLYDPAAIDAFLRDHVDRAVPQLEPTRLYTARQLEAAGVGITAGTIRADRTRGRWPAPDSADGGTNRWTGATATKALANRRGYRKATGEQQ